MIIINFFEDITFYHYVGTGIGVDILYTRVIIDNKIHHYYQIKDTSTITITDEIIEDLHKCIMQSMISLKNHLNLLEMSKQNDVIYKLKINGDYIKDYKFVDARRSLKLKQLMKNDRHRDIIKADY